MDEYVPRQDSEYLDISVCARFGIFCCQFVCECLRAGIPIRGSIALGEAKIDTSNNAFIGPPIVEAVHCESKEQKWIGVQFCQSFLDADAHNLPAMIPYKKHIPEKPDLPRFASYFALDWPRYWHLKHSDSNPEEVINRMLVETNAPSPKYYECAIDFIRTSEKYSEWFKLCSDTELRKLLDSGTSNEAALAWMERNY